MNAKTALEQMETSAYRSRVDHGLFDIGLGLLWMVVSIALLTQLWVGLVIGVPLAMVLEAQLPRLLRGLVEPRVGLVQLGHTRLARISRGRAIAAALVCFGAFALGLAFRDAHDGLLLAIANAMATGCIALLLSLPRFYLYGALILALPWLAFLLEQPISAGWLLAAALVTIAGSLRLVGFLRDNPRLDQEDS